MHFTELCYTSKNQGEPKYPQYIPLTCKNIYDVSSSDIKKSNFIPSEKTIQKIKVTAKQCAVIVAVF